jgi:hypothetical protein
MPYVISINNILQLNQVKNIVAFLLVLMGKMFSTFVAHEMCRFLSGFNANRFYGKKYVVSRVAAVYLFEITMKFDVFKKYILS